MKLILEFVYKDLDNDFDSVVFNSGYIIETIKNKLKKKYENVCKAFISGKKTRKLKNTVFYIFNENIKKLFSIN